MAATCYVDVWCDVCYDWVEGDSKTIRGARRNVKYRYGWVYRKIDGRMMDLCEECAETYVGHSESAPETVSTNKDNVSPEY